MPRSQVDSEQVKRRAAWKQAMMMLAVALCTAVVFGRVLQCDFLRWDDQDTVSQNPAFNPAVDWERVKEAWNPDNGFKSLWIPVTYTLWAVIADISPRGPTNAERITLSPILFHLLNLLIHCISAGIAYGILRKLVKSNVAAFMGALFFALHPVMVEPVAWVSGTKDVLAGCLSLLGIYEYIRFRDPEVPRQEQLTHFFVGILCFVIAMLAKPSSVTLPLILFVIDWLLLKTPLVKAAVWSLPWLILSIPIVIIGIRQQPAKQTGFIEYWMRPFIAGDAIAFYIGKIFWPVTLVIDYGRNPDWLKAQGSLMYMTTAVTVAFVIAGLLLRRKFPALLAAMGVLVGATLPVLGFVTFEFEWYSTVADHYLYVGMLGPAILVGVVLERWRLPVVYAAGGLVLALLAVRSGTQIDHWRNTLTMRRHVINVNPQSPAGYHAAGHLLAQQGRYDEAIEQYKKALEVRPNFGMTHYDMANAMQRGGKDLNEVLKQYEIAARLMPDDADPFLNMGAVLASLGRYEDAETALRRSIELNPARADAYASLGHVLLRMNHRRSAFEMFNTALDIEPGNQRAIMGLERLGRRPGEPLR